MRVRLCDFPTGRRILDLPFIDASYTSVINDAEELSATVDLNDRVIKALDLRNSASPVKSCLIIEDKNLVVGGPCWVSSYDHDKGTMQIAAKGLWSYFGHRTLLPPMQPSDRLTNADGTANTAFDTNINNSSYETIVKRWIQQANAWMPQALQLPIVYEDDVSGSFVRSMKGAETKIISDMLTNITGVEQGIDIRFRPRRTSDGLGYEWLLQCGHPRLTSQSVKKWNMDVKKSPITGLQVTSDGTYMASQVWETGGASSDTAIIERAIDTTMAAKGYPLLEVVESLSTSVTTNETALSHAVETLRTSTVPRYSWSFNAQRDETLGSDWDAGDMCSLKTKDDPFITDGWHDMRIMALAGDSKSEKIQVTTGLIYG